MPAAQLCYWPSVTQGLVSAGLDAAEIVSQLRAGHASDQDTKIGVDVVAGTVGDMSKLGVFEAFKVGAQLLCLVHRAQSHTKLAWPAHIDTLCRMVQHNCL